MIYFIKGRSFRQNFRCLNYDVVQTSYNIFPNTTVKMNPFYQIYCFRLLKRINATGIKIELCHKLFQLRLLLSNIYAILVCKQNNALLRILLENIEH